MQDYDVTQEQYETTEQAMLVYQRQFSFKNTICNQVTAFKSSLVDVFKDERVSDRFASSGKSIAGIGI